VVVRNVTAFRVLRWLWALRWLGSTAGGDIPRDVNVAIVISRVTFDTDRPAVWAARLDTWAAFENAYEDRPGDCPGLPVGSRDCTRAKGARSCGPWQIECRRIPVGMPLEDQARIALSIMQASEKQCPRWPMMVYATGVCVETTKPIAFRMSKINRAVGIPIP
jgi:hypothetical protein